MNDPTVRQATPDDALAIARVRVDSWRTTYKGMIPDAYLAAMNVDDSAALWSRVLSAASTRACVFVAGTPAEVVGFAAANRLPEPKHGLDAELTAIYIRRDRQRAGTGRRLVTAIVDAMRGQGATGLLTWVIAANRVARAFYEGLGAELLVEQAFQWDGMDLVEAGYGWRDLDALAAAAAGHRRQSKHLAAEAHSGEGK
jgi:GNAT superfamily N-acetyltransferase